MAKQSFRVIATHDGLNKRKVITGSNRYEVEHRAREQLRIWNELWKQKQAKEHQRVQKEQEQAYKQAQKELAIERTQEAQEAIESVRNTLKYTLKIDDKINWDSLKDSSEFEKAPPVQPKKTDPKYKPKAGFLTHVIPRKRKQALDEAEALFIADYNKWQKRQQEWETEKAEFLQAQRDRNKTIEEQKEEYLKKSPSAIIAYCEMVLGNSSYSDSFPKEFELDYNPENKILIVEYQLPSLDNIPTLQEVKYIQNGDEFKEVFISESAKTALYDSLVYQITLRTIHELYEADAIQAIDAIVFNGWVKSINAGTGQEVSSCIVSVQASRKEFLSINLDKVDPKICFKTLKGVGSSKLHSLTPIAPVLAIDREDRRFVTSYMVTGSLDESYNLAAMNWEDFEHLIREMFEKEFSQTGGEVKITQASRDGGVDAVAFDPDPIRGGKIVIQAKRYTNVVGVSTVRDLYGTVINEGATKGILITTADYSPDAYEFAKGKPLTLLSGGNLLYLLEKHGHKARIDLREAKQILAEREKHRL